MLLDLPEAASFTNLSAASLPLTLLWLDIQCIVTLHGRSLMALVSIVIRCCPEDGFAPLRLRIIAWLSMYIVAFFPTTSGAVLSSQVASIAPTISASYVLCFVMGLRCFLSDLIG